MSWWLKKYTGLYRYFHLKNAGWPKRMGHITCKSMGAVSMWGETLCRLFTHNVLNSARSNILWIGLHMFKATKHKELSFDISCALFGNRVIFPQTEEGNVAAINISWWNENKSTVNTRRWAIVGLMLVERLRRRPHIEPMIPALKKIKRFIMVVES